MSLIPCPAPVNVIKPGKYWLSPLLRFYYAEQGHTAFLKKHVAPIPDDQTPGEVEDEYYYDYALSRGWYRVQTLSACFLSKNPGIVIDNESLILPERVLKACVDMALVSDQPTVMHGHDLRVVWKNPHELIS